MTQMVVIRMTFIGIVYLKSNAFPFFLTFWNTFLTSLLLDLWRTSLMTFHAFQLNFQPCMDYQVIIIHFHYVLNKYYRISRKLLPSENFLTHVQKPVQHSNILEKWMLNTQVSQIIPKKWILVWLWRWSRSIWRISNLWNYKCYWIRWWHIGIICWIFLLWHICQID